MHATMWTYPWDVQDLTAERVEAELRTAGIDTISLASAYHAGRFLQPRSLRRKSYYPEDGTIYFEPTPARWADSRIRPRVAALTREADVLRDLVRRRDEGGLRVSAWTVCLHNTRLGLLHPEAVTRNAFGDANIFSLCPSHPDARAYVRTLVADLSATYRPDTIELESPSFMGYAHGFHHEKDGVGLLAEDDFLLSLCFCPACLARAAAAGVDGEAARSTVRRWIAEACDRAVPEPRWPDFPASGLDVLRSHPEVEAYARWRFEPVTSLLQELRGEAHPATRLVLIAGDNAWLEGADLGAASRALDGVILCAYDRSPDEVEVLLTRGRAEIGADKALGAGFRLFYPEMTAPVDVVDRVAAAGRGGADGAHFYNYGLVPQARLDWVAAACR
ncbi:MAG: hypothetical protein ACRYGP_32990 [Janthinobacterium lividum]